MSKRVVIVDLKVPRDGRHAGNGVLYCGLIDHEAGERMIQADLEYIMEAVKRRDYEILDAQDLLYKISQHYKFTNKDKPNGEFATLNTGESK